MYALVLSNNIFISSFVSRGLKYENIQSTPLEFRHLDLTSMNMADFDCIIIKVERDLIDEIKSLIVNSLPNKPIYLIKPKNMDIQIEKKNLNVIDNEISMKQIAYDMKRKIYGLNYTKNKKVIRIADLTLDIQKRSATRFNKRINLRNKEFQLLEFLMHNAEIVFSRQKILEQVWDRNANMFTNTIDVHINILRKKLDYKKGLRLIETIHSHGYIMHQKPFG